MFNAGARGYDIYTFSYPFRQAFTNANLVRYSHGIAVDDDASRIFTYFCVSLQDDDLSLSLAACAWW